MLKRLLKTISSDVRQAIVSAIVGAAFLSLGGILYLSKTALTFCLAILTAPAQTWGILVVVLGVVLVYMRLLSNQKGSSQSPDIFKIHQVITLAVNDYHEFQFRPGFMAKIELKEIKKDIIPNPYLIANGEKELEEKEVAIINFDKLYPLSTGSCVKQIDENKINEGMTFSMPKYSSFSEEDASVFSFAITNSYDQMNFFRCIVKHINFTKQEAELDIYYVRSEK